MAALSWLLFYRLYSRGVLARDADHKTIDASLKTIRKEEKESNEKPDSLVHGKWMKFGGGFYGVAAAWTLIYIEASGIVGVVLHPSVVLDTFNKGIGDFIAQKISGQVTTLIDAATWFSWWPDRGHGPVVWFVVAYVAYIAGLNLARYETGLGSRAVKLDSRAWWRSLVPFKKDRDETVKEDGGDPLRPPG
ncbi:MAG: hypothetical protein P4L92_02655 [Rudaea sp.]|nr:hypothetical protein [Rudaea sp.]